METKFKPDSEKAIEVVVFLTELTQKGELSWNQIQLNEIPLIDKPNQDILACYRMKFHDIRFSLWKEKNKQTLDVFKASILLGAMQTKTHGRLEVINDDNKTEWVFPYMNAIDNLLETVEFKVGGSRDYLEKLLQYRNEYRHKVQ